MLKEKCPSSRRKSPSESNMNLPDASKRNWNGNNVGKYSILFPSTNKKNGNWKILKFIASQKILDGTELLYTNQNLPKEKKKSTLLSTVSGDDG